MAIALLPHSLGTLPSCVQLEELSEVWNELQGLQLANICGPFICILDTALDISHEILFSTHLLLRVSLAQDLCSLLCIRDFFLTLLMLIFHSVPFCGRCTWNIASGDLSFRLR